METSQTLNELATALSKAQGEMRNAQKDGTNPHFKAQYATLDSVWDACRAPLSKHGLSVIQTLSTSAQGVQISTMLLHSSGQWVKDSLELTPRDASPQSAGSAVTYGRRYSLMAIVGIAPGDDDDGNAATFANGTVKPEQPAWNDGVQNMDVGYRIPFGKFNKRKLDEVDVNDLRSYVDYIEKKAEKDNKPLQGNVLEFVERATAHIVAIEGGESDVPGSFEGFKQ